ncbi:MAG TPA: MmgE/PrpD family protein, partial [Dehalococcoidia bacterium]|nr:MmgE/PrpD family protein [Dehalococcoidia bacterium]
QNFGTMTKPLHPGLAARAGVVAADLASRGFTADEAIIDAPMGFVHLFSPGQDGDPNAIPELGRPWDIVDPGISVKKYPCCFVTHNALDAILDLKAEAGFSAGDVAAVEVHMPEGSAAPLIHPRPRTGLEGKFSMPYAMAAALLDGQPVLSTFEDEAVQRPEAQELLRRCDLVFDPLQGELLAAYADVVVKLRDGRTLSKRSERPRGGPDAPLSREELAIKYRDCARRVLSAEDAERSLTMVESLEDLSDIRELMSLLCRTSVPAAAG